MSGRVSIKGQGADIFFGEAGGEGADNSRKDMMPVPDQDRDPEHVLSPPQESKPASKAAGQVASQQDSLPASKQDSQQDSQQARPAQEGAGRLSASTRRKLRDLLEREHRTHNTYRYHDDELAAVRDIVYELEVRRGMKVTRNDVMRAALLWTIEDYNNRGEDSCLMQLLREGD
jgi:hypothetical protein